MNNKEFENLFRSINKISPHLIVLFLFVLFSLLRFKQVCLYIPFGDDAEYVNNAFRILLGEKPYIDYWLLFPPGEVLLPALILKIFQGNGFSLLVLEWFSYIVAGVLIFVLVNNISKNSLFSAWISSIFCLMGFIEMHLLCIIVSIYFLFQYSKQQTTKYLILFSIFIGFSMCFSFYDIVPFFIASYIYMIYIYNDKKQMFSRILKITIVFLVPMILILFIEFLYLGNYFSKFLNETLIESVKHLNVSSLPYMDSATIHMEYLLSHTFHHNSTEYLRHLLHYLFMLITYLFPLISTFFGVLTLSLLLKEKPKKHFLILFIIWGILMLPRIFGRSDYYHILRVNTVFYFQAFLIILLEKKEKPIRLIKGVLISILMLISITGVLQTLIDLEFLIKPIYIVRSQHSKYYTSEKKSYKITQDLVDTILTNTNEEDYIFVVPWGAPPLYFMTNRRNPTYYDSLIDVVLRPTTEKQLRIIESLEKNNVKLIIWLEEEKFDGYNSRKLIRNCKQLNFYIKHKYFCVKSIGEYKVYLRKKDS